MFNSSRLFFALWPDDETRLALARLNLAIVANEFKPVQAHNLHVTLVFLGQVSADIETLIKQAVDDISAQPFALTFDNVEYWARPKVLCLTCQQPEQEVALLAAALETVAANCGLHTDIRPYIPHITLARQIRYLPEVKMEPIVWRAAAFCLVESCREPDGVYYKVLQQWPFIKSRVNPE